MAQITLRDYLQETEDAIGSKQTEKALANCQSILAQFPDSLEAQRLLGEVYLAQGRLEDAQHSFDWVLSNDPENVIAYCSRALVSKDMSDYDTALDCYQQAYELSRGSSQIRRAFNELSEQVGQQGFMLSRAGLARLYMRGDLIAQAIQEWEVVLAATPDRLDARTGLLEAYWREGFYDQVSQLANQILRDVPGCVKALVLLAHVTAPQDMLQSQELVQRAEVLDPDLIMAHDLFADHLASQSRDPFLKLLKKPPVMLAEETAGKSGSVSTDSPATATNFAFASTATSSSDALATWGNNEVTLNRPGFEDQQAVPSFSAWNADVENRAGSSAGQLQSSGSQWGNADAAYPSSWGAFNLDTQTTSSSNGSDQPEPWQLLQNALNNMNPEVTLSASQHGLSHLEAQHDTNIFSEPSQPVQESGGFMEEMSARVPDGKQPIEDSQALPSQQENNSSAPPVWLNMLAQTERSQLTGGMPVVSPGEQRQAPQPPTPQVEREPIYENNANRASSASPDAGEGDADEEESFFGPDWLKSLGAASLEGDQVEEFSMVVPPTQAPPETSKTMAPPEETREIWPAQPEVTIDPMVGGSFQTQQEQPKRGSWLDALGSSPEYEQHKPAYQSWEDNLTAGMQQDQPVAEYKVEQNSWAEPQYEMNAQQDNELQLTQIQESKPEEEQEPSWSAYIAQPQEPPMRGSWLDALGSSPEYEQHEPAHQSWEDSLMPGVQPETERGEKEQLLGEAWDSHWSDAEKGQPSWLSQMSGSQAQSVDEAWQPLPVEVQPQVNEKAEQNIVTTLEELEQKLFSRGFIPLEPNSLSTIAQAQSVPSSPEEPVHTAAYEAQDYRQEPSLSSALAELGSFIQPAASDEKPLATPVQPAAFNEKPLAIPVQPMVPDEKPMVAPFQSVPEQQAAEPSWLTSVRAMPVPSASEVVNQSVSRQEARPTIEKAPPYQRREAAKFLPPEPKVPSPARAEIAFSPTFEPSEAPKSQPLQEAAARMNPLLDSELETTMKRPAVRLQPMQTRALPTREAAPPPSRGRATEQVTINPGNGNSNHRERLLRGYQSQLIGDYDSAMQEYRIIIRSTPELLGEVVSNLRALLKLAPKYSVGYRVLGDAYMRQGEYLQAMEAYNKALTMAKKAKN